RQPCTHSAPLSPPRTAGSLPDPASFAMLAIGEIGLPRAEKRCGRVEDGVTGRQPSLGLRPHFG
ncbi:MAG: hypothetical protein OXC91_06580, partial [Rhodobacteraceae bacterium]|nr:hypothetical protein [Paracoccaceae bacterium]